MNDPRIFVPMGEFMHNGSKLLDQIEKDRLTIVLTRFGRPAAVIEPFSAHQPKPAVPDERDRQAWAALGDVPRRILAAALAARPGLWGPSDYIGTRVEFHQALFDLEAGELLQKDFGGYRLTETGERVAALGG